MKIESSNYAQKIILEIRIKNLDTYSQSDKNPIKVKRQFRNKQEQNNIKVTVQADIASNGSLH